MSIKTKTIHSPPHCSNTSRPSLNISVRFINLLSTHSIQFPCVYMCIVVAYSGCRNIWTWLIISRFSGRGRSLTCRRTYTLPTGRTFNARTNETQKNRAIRSYSRSFVQHRQHAICNSRDVIEHHNSDVRPSRFLEKNCRGRISLKTRT